MRNITIRGVILTISLISLTACSRLAPEVQMRTYNQDKKRIDQIVEGTVGNWQHAPQAVATQTKDTRKVYFVEFSKEPMTPPNLDYLVANEKPSKEMMEEVALKDVSPRVSRKSTKRPAPRSASVGLRQPRLDIPDIEDAEYYEEESFDTQLSYKNYKVQKSDTLQKISKKFYNSYSKWQPIYEANKDVITNPDVLQPGMSLKIPVQ